jgi:hypothetical protein
MNYFFDTVEDIIKLIVDEKVEDSSELVIKKEKNKNVAITKMRYKGKPFLMIINDYKTIILYTYG